ncbi:MAG: exodeoxyribonuclease V subunit beta [bacterium]
MQPFDLLGSPLEGRNLIEASAGTGKTYTIAGLYLRLLLEKRLSVEQILVVTFTLAATEELRSRIRRRIREAHEAFSSEQSQDPFLAGLVGKVKNAAEARILLTNALRCFDEAAIFTIHGFCQRTLLDKAFECHSLFSTNFISDQSTFLQEAVDDFWRIHVYTASPEFIGFLRQKKTSPESLASLAGRYAGRPFLRIIPEHECIETDGLEKKCREAFDELGRIWFESQEDVEDLLLHHKGLNRHSYREASLEKWSKEVSRYLSSGSLFPCCEKLAKFGAGSLAGAVKKGCEAPDHPLFSKCDEFLRLLRELEEAFGRKLQAFKRKLLAFVQEELPRRKRKENLQSFDDLLLTVQSALQKDGGEALAGELRRKYQAALIDEFQDTDPVQFAIFTTIYPDRKSTLFLIGDPKQAIYSFRGADIFAYLEARKAVEWQYTLDTNWRSSPELVRAINTLFSNRRNPFVYPDIPFYRIKSAFEASTNGLAWGEGHEQDRAPFRLWFMTRGDSGKLISKGTAEEKVPEAVADEIGRLLGEGKAGRAVLHLDGRPVEAKDIAVLVRTNRQARLVQEALRSRGIPSVLYSTESLFSSREARELLTVLSAVADSTHESSVRAALATDMMGVSGDDLAVLIGDETAWTGRLEKFSRFHELWRERGCITMSRTLVAQEGVRSRLLAYPDGDRRLTNLLHCFEVLHQASLEHKLGMKGLIKWFARQIEEQPEKEEYQIRLETDEEAVRLITIHRSKGLEYPIVFCPFVWGAGGGKENSEVTFFHDPDQGRKATLVLGSPDGAESSFRSLMKKEILAENLRLLYVALTRARERVYLVWGAFREQEILAPAFLLHPNGEEKTDDPADPADPDNLLAESESPLANLEDRQMLNDLEALVRKAEGAITVSPLPERTCASYRTRQDVPSLFLRRFSRVIPCRRLTASFSSLTSGKAEGWDEPGSDDLSMSGESDERTAEEELEAPEREDSLTILQFPRGAKAGTCLHEIFERLDFASQDHEVTLPIVQERLLIHGFSEDWTPAVCSMVRNVLSTPLEEGKPDFTLSTLSRHGRIRNRDQVREMPFYFPIASITSRRLGEILKAFGGPNVPERLADLVGKLDFTQTGGFLKGYIDLVFQHDGSYFLLDWKSNYLGSSLEHYRKGTLQETMEREYYFLQYHLYTVALHKYLARRIPGYDVETHFGGIFYVFLRGVAPEAPHYGIFRDRPSRALIEALSRYFEGSAL